MAGTIITSTIQGTTLTDGTNSTSTTNCIQGSAKAWVNYNQGTSTILASYNVSSVVLNSTGTFTVNFTNAFSDANYCLGSFVRGDITSLTAVYALSAASNGTKTTSAIQLIVRYANTGGSGAFNSPEVGVIFLR